MARDEAGIVVNASAKGLLVKAPRMLPIGSRVVDVRSRPVGRVVDVLGPVAAPYLLVKPGRGAKTQRLLSHQVFTP